MDSNCIITEILRQGTGHKPIATFTALKLWLRIGWDWAWALNDLGEQRNLTLACLPGHEGIKGYERADALAQKAAANPFIGPIPSCGITKREVAETTGKEEEIHSRIYVGTLKFTDDFLEKDRITVKLIVGIQTGLCRVNKYASNLGDGKCYVQNLSDTRRDSAVYFMLMRGVNQTEARTYAINVKRLVIRKLNNNERKL